MIKDNLEIYELSLVLIGQFNPILIQPVWLSEKKLIRETEVNSDNIDLIHKELTRFKLEWATFEVTRERFEVRSTKVPFFEPIKDITLSIFNLLKETPIRSLGINHIMHFPLKDKDKYQKLGERIYPLHIWKDILNDPKLMQFEVIEQKRRDGLFGHVRVKIEPSELLAKDFGVVINMNDHYTIKAESSGRNNEIIELLKKNWESSLTRAKEITNKLWDLVEL